jgi:hypothetical protein
MIDVTPMMARGARSCVRMCVRACVPARRWTRTGTGTPASRQRISSIAGAQHTPRRTHSLTDGGSVLQGTPSTPGRARWGELRTEGKRVPRHRGSRSRQTQGTCSVHLMPPSAATAVGDRRRPLPTAVPSD